MTYQPNPGYQQQPSHPFPPTGGPAPGPHPSGPHWTAPPPPPRRPRPVLLIAIIVAVLVAAGVVTLVLTTSGGTTSRLTNGAGGSLADSSVAASATADPTSGGPNSSRALPPPTPTGQPYKNDDPQPGDCVDLSRSPTGVSIYHADCDDPAATLILESVLPQSEKCPAKGYFGLNSLSKQRMCFTYNFAVGDCIDMDIPRRTACAATTAPAAPKPIVTVADIRLGQQDGAGCANPALFLQVGKDDQRGTACLVADLPPNPTAPPSR